ncbi:MAG TPA: hypothetical protein VMN79_01260 [Casimicrobiaceae bacterium]|nr:hypothetical protein [Casimicrobiaceae bacterium]
MTTFSASMRAAMAGIVGTLGLWLALGSLGSATAALAEATPGAGAGCPGQPPMTAVFTGVLEHGVPVYRLPRLTVSAGRGAAVAEARTAKRDAHAARGRAAS